MKIQSILFSCLIIVLPLQELTAQPATVAASFPEIRIYISKSQYNTLLQSKGRKLELTKPVFLISGDTAKVKEVHSRGNNSLTFEHKSLSVELANAMDVRINYKKTKIKKFDLLNLVMDKNLWHNRWAFLNMSDLAIFPLLNTFCTLWINDQPQGIYMLVEKPRHYTTSKVKSSYMIRRGVDHVISDEYIDTPSKEDAKKYKQQYLDIYKNIEKHHGDDLLKFLNSKLYLDHYFKWIAFNYLIMNGDYADELYLYVLPENGLFDVIPWDYDDILKPVPHEGREARNSIASLKNKLIFSSEDPLDRAIGSDEVVYAEYISSFRQLLLALTPENLKRISLQVKEELQLLSTDPTAPASLFLGKDPFSMTSAEADIDLALDFIISRRNALLKAMEK